MAQPTPYERVASFQDIQALSPSTPIPGQSLDSEYNAVVNTFNEILANLALIQRDDGKLANESVGLEQLAVGVLDGVEAVTITDAGRALLDDATVAEQVETLAVVSYAESQGLGQSQRFEARKNIGLPDLAADQFWVGQGSSENPVAVAPEAARTALGLGTIATQAADDVALTGGSLTDVAVNVKAPDDAEAVFRNLAEMVHGNVITPEDYDIEPNITYGAGLDDAAAGRVTAAIQKAIDKATALGRPCMLMLRPQTYQVLKVSGQEFCLQGTPSNLFVYGYGAKLVRKRTPGIVEDAGHVWDWRPLSEVTDRGVFYFTGGGIYGLEVDGGLGLQQVAGDPELTGTAGWVEGAGGSATTFEIFRGEDTSVRPTSFKVTKNDASGAVVNRDYRYPFEVPQANIDGSVVYQITCRVTDVAVGASARVFVSDTQTGAAVSTTAILSAAGGVNFQWTPSTAGTYYLAMRVQSDTQDDYAMFREVRCWPLLGEHEGAVIRAWGSRGWRLIDCYFHDNPHYLIGLQGGAIQDCQIVGFHGEDSLYDGIDVKDYGSISYGNVIDRAWLRRCGIGGVASTSPSASLDFMGRGWVISNPTILEFGAHDKNQSGIRGKSTNTTQGRGHGPRQSYVYGHRLIASPGASGVTNTRGIHDQEGALSIGPGYVEGAERGVHAAGNGVESLIEGQHITGCGTGIEVALNNSRAIVHGNRVTGNDKGIVSAADDGVYRDNICTDNDTSDLEFASGANNNVVCGGEVEVVSDGGTGNIFSAVKGYKTQAKLSGTFELDSTGLKTVTIAHGLAKTPLLLQVVASLSLETAVTDFVVDFMRVHSVDATNVGLRVQVGTASATGGALGRVNVHVDATGL
ncbi:MAG: hypothetical protein GEV06_16770 [Luteitalea sp.]|nr:hypothetical protein [Luteitalea sp.]